MPGQCPRCKKAVYFAEEKMVLGKPFHKMCIKCANCNKMLDSGSVTDHKDEIYCRSCYGRLFGPKGYGYGIGAGVLSMDDGTRYQNGPPRSNVPSTVEAYIAPLVQSNNINNNNNNTTGSGGVSNNEVTSTTVLTSRDSNGVTTTRQTSVTSTTNNNNAAIIRGSTNASGITCHPGNRPPSGTAPAAPRWGGGSYCTRCSKSVFMAERVMAAGGAWHKACFTCQECNKRLDSHSIRERERNIYCNPCYGKNFGPKGYTAWSAAKVS